MAGKIDAKKDYKLEEIAELFQLDTGTIQKWRDVGFIAEESGENCRLQVKENQQVSGRGLLHFIERARFNKTLFDKKFFMILGVALAVAFFLMLLSVLITDDPFPIVLVMLLWAFAMIPFIVWREVCLKNYSRIELDSWKSIQDSERDSVSVSIRSRLKRNQWILFFWLGAVLFIYLFRGKLLNAWRFKYHFEQYFIAVAVMQGWEEVLGFIFEQNMIAPRSWALIKPNYENRYVRWMGFVLGLIFLTVGIVYFCKK
ncbi:MAG: hypothetical protein NTW95_07765 [Candidatus Aminicenantes bacterium]|nr:hypothetical protein [Candidatus Aminicenantes bacterium]